MCFFSLFNLCKKPKKKLLTKENRDREDDLIDTEKKSLNKNNNNNNNNNFRNYRDLNDIVIETKNGISSTDLIITPTSFETKKNISLGLANQKLNNNINSSSCSVSESSASSSCNSMTSLNLIIDNNNNNNNNKLKNKMLLNVDLNNNINNNHNINIDDENASLMNKDSLKLLPTQESSISSQPFKGISKPQLNLNIDLSRTKPKFDFFSHNNMNLGFNNQSFNNNNNIFNKSNKLFMEANSILPPLIHKNSTSDVSEKAGKLTISPNEIYDFDESELNEINEIGHGEFGSVYKVIHKPTNTLMALKKIRSNVDPKEQRKLIRELDIVMKCNDFTYVVKFYGVKFNTKDGDCLICMELMNTSLDLFYKYIYDVLNDRIPERILGQILLSTLKALNYLKEKLQIIHRDVKPSNILLNKEGSIKLCDFGISGRLVNSIAQTMDVGCRPYMAPERIDPNRPQRGYDVRSDVWSLGITLYELATGKFPYQQWSNVFEQLHSVVHNEAPILKCDHLTTNFCSFVNTCLTKDDTKRPKYKDLLRHPYVVEQEQKQVQIGDYVTSIIDKMNEK